MITEKTLLKDSGVKKVDKSSRVLSKKKNPAEKQIKVVYECEGTEEENQERLDDIFDFIFDEVMKKRESGQRY